MEEGEKKNVEPVLAFFVTVALVHIFYSMYSIVFIELVK